MDKKQSYNKRIVDFSLGENYVDIRPLDEGGMGEVYFARRKGLEVDVVIKRVKSTLRDRVDQLNEADILKKLKHRYLPRIYDIINGNDGYIYTIMDYIPGVNLREYIKINGPADQQQVIKWGEQLCEVTSYLHEQTPPIIHCDIKPGNIMITPNGDICLIDFNTSLVFGAVGVNIGASTGYAAPEQYLCENNMALREIQAVQMNLQGVDETEVTDLTENESMHFEKSTLPETMKETQEYCIDKFTDVYGIGATMYFMLSGHRPEISSEPVTPISERTGNTSKNLLDVIEHAMEKEPQKRFEDAKQMLLAIQEVVPLDLKQKQLSILKKIIKYAVIAAAMILVSGVLYKKISYEKEYKQGQQYYSLQKYKEAIEAYKKSIDISPEKADAYLELAKIYIEMTDVETALEQLNIAIELDGQCAEAYKIRGECYIQLAELENAKLDLEKALEFDETLRNECEQKIAAIEDGTLKNQICENALEKSEEYLIRKEYDFALEWAEIAVKVNSHSAQGYIQLADVYCGTSQYKEALTNLNIAIEMDGALKQDLSKRLSALQNEGSHEDNLGNTYDVWGHQTKKVYYDLEENLCWSHELEYANARQGEKITSFDAVGNVTGEIDIKYNDKNQLIETYWFSYDDGIVFPLALNYDKDGNMIEECGTDLDGNVMTRRVYEFDVQGEVTKCTVYGVNDTFEDCCTYETKEDGSRICSHYTEEGNLEFYVEQSFNKDGQVIQEKYFADDDSMLYILGYEYDEEGNRSTSIYQFQ